MRLDAYSITLPTRPSRTFALRDGFSGKEGQLEVRRLSTMEIVSNHGKAAEYVAEHITGRGPIITEGPKIGQVDTGHRDYVPPRPVGAVDGQPIMVSERTIAMLAAIEYAQIGDDPYRFDELAAMCMSDELAVTLMEVYDWIQPTFEVAGEGNPPDGSGQESLPTPSDDSTASPN